MPFKTQKQAAACYAKKSRGEAGSWDCDEWAAHTDFSKLPKGKNKKKTKSESIIDGWLMAGITEATLMDAAADIVEEGFLDSLGKLFAGGDDEKATDHFHEGSIEHRLAELITPQMLQGYRGKSLKDKATQAVEDLKQQLIAFMRYYPQVPEEKAYDAFIHYLKHKDLPKNFKRDSSELDRLGGEFHNPASSTERQNRESSGRLRGYGD